MAKPRQQARSRSALVCAWKCLWFVVGLTVITMTGLYTSHAADPQDYFLPPGGRIIEMPPMTWREKEMRDKALLPPDCGGTCHRPLGFSEDEPFLRAAATYATERKEWLRTEREAEAALARGGQASDYGSRLQRGAGRLQQAAQPYTSALSLYARQLQARGVSLTRVNWLERLHGLYIP